MKTEKKVSFPLLNIIYSDNQYFTEHLKMNDDFDVDHIHPQSKFDKDKDDNRYDTIPNLQLPFQFPIPNSQLSIFNFQFSIYLKSITSAFG